jgi:cobalt-zinc-cadmium efflux system membrane fusion protein
MNLKSNSHFYLTVLSAILFMSACGGAKNENKETPHVKRVNRVTLVESQFKNAKIGLTTLSSKSIPAMLKLHGKIDVPPQNMVSISVPLGGYLRSTALLPGMHVNKGQVIATMEDQQYIQIQQDYLTAMNQLDLLRKEYERQKELNQSKAVSDKVYQQAESAYRGQQVMVNAYREKLKLININPGPLRAASISRSIPVFSPIDGYVSSVKANVGKYVSPSDVLFELVNPADIHLNLTVYEKDIESLYIGQQVWAFTNNDTSKKHACEIILIGKDLSSERSMEVHCHFKNYDKLLLPGMYMNAEIELNSTVANVLPDDAVVRYEGKYYVFVEKGLYAYEMMEVSVGKISQGYVEVFSPEISAADKIVSAGAYTLLMSLKNKSDE